MRRLLLVLLLLLPLHAAAVRAQKLDIPPKPTAWVTDRGGVLSADQQQMLNQKLESFAQRSGSQFLVFIYPTLGDEAIEDYTVRVAEQWKVKQDRALIIFVFLKEHKVRIEVGYGLEGAVPDAYAYRVTQEQMAPAFRNSDYAGGLSAAIDTLAARVEGKEAPIPHEGTPGGAPNQQVSIGDLLPFIIIVLIFFFVVAPMFRRSGCGGCGCLPLFFPFGGGGTTFGGGGGGWSSGGGGGGWSVGGGWGGGGGGSFGGGGATGGW